ncbi:MAG TPA: hypothetical protein VFE27_01360 [Acidobacteriaceae bacterium]|jgi:hypothetical protein|nr:hypothetical protein [Acidobacteriaceae bacterium]
MVATVAVAQVAAPAIIVDSDHDGLSDNLEYSLLLQFLPAFMISSEDCSSRPALFRPQAVMPTVVAEDGTIYGQVFPRKNHGGEIELHFYHLWRRDCGEMGHLLDTEHVSVLIGKTVNDSSAAWKAIYWYAAAHEDTVCDASQIARASTIDAETHGTRIWISAAKHASFLSRELCARGCGGDQCNRMTPLKVEEVINLGESSRPMNGAIWLTSSRWPLRDKMRRTDFTDARIDRLDRLPATDIAWANPAKRPAQSAIFGVNAGIGGAMTGTRTTNTALVVAENGTTTALDQATGNATHSVSGAIHSVGKALRKSIQKTGQVLGVESKQNADGQP